jgi:hypothetical protein
LLAAATCLLLLLACSCLLLAAAACLLLLLAAAYFLVLPAACCCHDCRRRRHTKNITANINITVLKSKPATITAQRLSSSIIKLINSRLVAPLPGHKYFISIVSCGTQRFETQYSKQACN